MTNAADDYAAIRRAMCQHEEAELANWLMMRASESQEPFFGQPSTLTNRLDASMGPVLAEIDGKNCIGTIQSDGRVVFTPIPESDYSSTDYVWPDPKA